MATTLDDNIEALARTITDEAEAEAAEILAEARRKAEDIRRRAQEQASAERKAALDRAKQESERLRGQSVATAELKARNLLLERREILLEEVFRAAEKKLPDIQKQPDYDQITCDLLREGITQLNASKAVVRADPVTLNILTDQVRGEISRDLKVEITVGEPLETGTGVVVDTGDGHLRYDNTLETRLSRMYPSLRSTVYRILTGETK
ncbi:MAG TPA: V-type ATP synthase subunit E family protein [Anaerolineaceae bacterium]|nr:V-type ATP synthase subunit E family protein [Anaerolineaceae bacterium]